MGVDRSYSPYESIRTYQDRGMMKWAAFATAELTEAQKKFLEKELSYPIDKRTANFKNEKRS